MSTGDVQLRRLVSMHLFFMVFMKSPPGKTMVDAGSRIHDRDGAAFTTYQAKNANSAWIRNATSMWVGGGLLGPIPTKRGWDKTFSREKNALGSRYSDDIDSDRSNGSFMRHQRYSKLFMPQARYNNLKDPGKWRL